jgi:hypothetical protein
VRFKSQETASRNAMASSEGPCFVVLAASVVDGT